MNLRRNAVQGMASIASMMRCNQGAVQQWRRPGGLPDALRYHSPMPSPASHSAPIRDLPPYAPALTGLRGVAAGWVLLFHLWQFMGTPRLALGPLDFTPLFARGHLGVDMFFVLSGYLIGGPWLVAKLRGEKRSLRGFWMRRIRRVLPAYWLQWLVLALVAWFGAAWMKNGPLPQGIAETLLGLTLTFNLTDPPLLNPVWWTLAVEWDFYLLAPLLAAGFAARGSVPWLLPCIVLACVAFRVLCWWHVFEYFDGVLYRWVQQLPSRLDQFALGMTVAWAFACGRAGRGAALLALGLAGTLAMVWIGFHVGPIVDTGLAPWLFFEFTLVGCAFAALVGAAALSDSALTMRLFANRPLVFVGTISYSLYLWHFPVLQWLRGFALAQGWTTTSWAFAAAALSLSAGFAWLSYRVAERPLLRGRAG